MKIQKFLDHHDIAENPFTEEDAQTDPVFKEHCIGSAFHPSWDKVYGDPSEPSTSVVFGEKGSGKTALRLQIARHLSEYNRSHPGRRLFVIEYDDFNPFLDRFRNKVPSRFRRADRALSQWKLWDHMDAILTLGVTRLVDLVLEAPPAPRRFPLPSWWKVSSGAPSSAAPASEAASSSYTNGHPGGAALDLASLDRLQARDLLLLAACYDQSPAETFQGRWGRLRRRLRFTSWQAMWAQVLGAGTTLSVFALIALLGRWAWLATAWPYLVVVAGWLPWFVRAWTWYWRSWQIARRVRVVNHSPGALRRVLMNLRGTEIAGQPLPIEDRTDDRYELLMKFQNVLRSLGYSGVIVLVDRVDEPHLINGSADRMRTLIWSMLDNKFLKHPGLGIKLLLPVELAHFVSREDREFYQRARLDKQNLVPSLEWTGQALYDVANARLKACAKPNASPALSDLLEDSIDHQRLLDALRGLRVPRHLFKFMYRLLVAHSNAHTDEEPAWKISRPTFESVLALYQRDQDALDRGLGAG